MKWNETNGGGKVIQDNVTRIWAQMSERDRDSSLLLLGGCSRTEWKSSKNTDNRYKDVGFWLENKVHAYTEPKTGQRKEAHTIQTEERKNREFCR